MGLSTKQKQQIGQKVREKYAPKALPRLPNNPPMLDLIGAAEARLADGLRIARINYFDELEAVLAEYAAEVGVK